MLKSLAINGFNSGYAKSDSGNDLISVIYSEKFFFIFIYSVPYIFSILYKFLFSKYSFSFLNLCDIKYIFKFCVVNEFKISLIKTGLYSSIFDAI